jgi:hypothetical protein
VFDGQTPATFSPQPEDSTPGASPEKIPPGTVTPEEPGSLLTEAGVPEDFFYRLPPVRCCGLWEFDVDMVGLRRQEANDFPLIIDRQTCCTVVDVGDLEFDYELGIRATVRRQIGCGRSWELAYLGIPEWRDGAYAVGNMDLRGPGFDLGVNPGVFVVSSHSSLYSGEIHFRKRSYCHWSWFAGFRYIRLNDALNVSELNAPFINAVQIDSANNLYGLQCGSEFTVFDRGGPLRVAGRAKVGMYLNDARQHTSSSFLGPPVGASARPGCFSECADEPRANCSKCSSARSSG